MDQLWFGTRQRFQWVPLPPPGVQRRRVSAFEGGTLDNGGGFAVRSVGAHDEWEFNYPVAEAHGAEGLDVFGEYAAGMWADYATITDGRNPNDLVYFVDPMNVASNLFPRHWAEPMLCLRGLPKIGDVVSHAATAANTHRHPPRTVTFSVTHTANTLPAQTSRKVLIPIPPGHTLRWGWSGTRTGTGVFRAEAHHKTGGATLVQSVTPLTVTGATRVGNDISGDTYDYVEIGHARTSSATSTVSPTSMMARMSPGSPDGPHVAGQGTTGCEFNGDAITEDYTLADGDLHLKGLSFGLIEIGGWLP